MKQDIFNNKFIDALNNCEKNLENSTFQDLYRAKLYCDYLEKIYSHIYSVTTSLRTNFDYEDEQMAEMVALCMVKAQNAAVDTNRFSCVLQNQINKKNKRLTGLITENSIKKELDRITKPTSYFEPFAKEMLEIHNVLLNKAPIYTSSFFKTPYGNFNFFKPGMFPEAGPDRFLIESKMDLGFNRCYNYDYQVEHNPNFLLIEEYLNVINYIVNDSTEQLNLEQYKNLANAYKNFSFDNCVPTDEEMLKLLHKQDFIENLDYYNEIIDTLYDSDELFKGKKEVSIKDAQNYIDNNLQTITTIDKFFELTGEKATTCNLVNLQKYLSFCNLIRTNACVKTETLDEYKNFDVVAGRISEGCELYACLQENAFLRDLNNPDNLKNFYLSYMEKHPELVEEQEEKPIEKEQKLKSF